MRFYGFVAMAFVTAFVAVSWASRGFPVGRLLFFGSPIAVSGLRANANMPTFGDESSKKFEQKAWLESKTMQSDKDPERDQLRMDTLQAATAYKLSPCNSDMKANLVKALTAYTESYLKILNCPVLMTCRSANFEASAAAFTTPLDKQVKDALHEAFEMGGISPSDFPKRIGFEMQQFAGYHGNSPSSCMASRQTERQRR